MKNEEKQLFLFALGGACACFGLSALYHAAVSETYANSAPLVNKNSRKNKQVVANTSAKKVQQMDSVTTIQYAVGIPCLVGVVIIVFFASGLNEVFQGKKKQRTDGSQSIRFDV